jgi:protein-S-isoprenylcysteine O-methyltransferase Ste14
MDETSSTSSTTNSAYDPTTTIPPVNGLRIPPPLLALACLASGLILHLLFSSQREVFAHHVIGLLLVAGGVGLSFYSAGNFDGRRTTKNPEGEATSLVTSAPYTFTRNPMYLGLTIVLFGFAVFFGSIVMLLAPIAFVVIIDRMVIPREEANMERLFGQTYVEYKVRVRRWI